MTGQVAFQLGLANLAPFKAYRSYNMDTVWPLPTPFRQQSVCIVGSHTVTAATFRYYTVSTLLGYLFACMHMGMFTLAEYSTDPHPRLYLQEAASKFARELCKAIPANEKQSLRIESQLVHAQAFCDVNAVERV